jgi:hypothetical protein
VHSCVSMCMRALLTCDVVGYGWLRAHRQHCTRTDLVARRKVWHLLDAALCKHGSVHDGCAAHARGHQRPGACGRRRSCLCAHCLCGRMRWPRPASCRRRTPRTRWTRSQRLYALRSVPTPWSSARGVSGRVRCSRLGGGVLTGRRSDGQGGFQLEQVWVAADADSLAVRVCVSPPGPILTACAAAADRVPGRLAAAGCDVRLRRGSALPTAPLGH